MAGDLPDVVERFVADVDSYVRDVERAARMADRFGEQQQDARDQVTRFGHAAEEAAERAARAQAEAAREAERLAEGTGDVERAARAAARAERELERAQTAQARAARVAAQQTDNEADQYRQLAREATQAAAAQRLAQLRAGGQIREHTALLRRLRQEYDGFGEDGDHAFREIESRARQTFEGFRRSGLGSINAVQAAVLLLPVAAAVAAGAITVGVGAALAGIGIMAAAQNERVKKSFSGLKNHVVTELKSWSTPFQTTLINISKIARSTFDSFGPDLRQVFAELAPVVTQFVDEAARGFEHFKPVIRDFSNAFQRVMADLGPRMDTILGNLADGLSSIANAAAQNPEQIGQLLQDLSEIAKLAGQLTAILGPLSTGFHDVSGALGGVTGALGPLMPVLTEAAKMFMAMLNPLSFAADGWRRIKQAMDIAGMGAEQTAGRMRAVDTTSRGVALAVGDANNAQTRSGILMQLASQSADKLKASLDALAGKELSSREAAAQYGQAVINMSKSLKENGRAHGYNTAKGIANEQALNQMATAAQNNAVAMRNNGAKAKDVAKYMEGARKKFIESAVAAGYHKDEAVKLADKLYGVRTAANKIPAKKNTKVTADTKEAEGGIRGFISWVGRQVARINVKALWPFAEGGLVPAYASGGQVEQSASRAGPGMVRGPGTGTSDGILARLSNGEFVMTAAATRRFGPLLAIMNRAAKGGVGVGHDTRRERRIPRGGVGAIEEGHQDRFPRPPRIYAPLPRAAAPATITHVTQNHFTIQGSVWAADELFGVIQRAAAKNNVRNPGLSQFGGR